MDRWRPRRFGGAVVPPKRRKFALIALTAQRLATSRTGDLGRMNRRRSCLESVHVVRLRDSAPSAINTAPCEADRSANGYVVVYPLLFGQSETRRSAEFSSVRRATSHIQKPQPEATAKGACEASTKEAFSRQPRFKLRNVLLTNAL
jgi:hypothetical protein